MPNRRVRTASVPGEGKGEGEGEGEGEGRPSKLGKNWPALA
jgi:hypothetical protein